LIRLHFLEKGSRNIHQTSFSIRRKKGFRHTLTKGKSPFDPAKIFHVGIVAKSIDETVKFYQEVFGIGVGEMLVPRQLTDENSWHSARRGIRQVASEPTPAETYNSLDAQFHFLYIQLTPKRVLIKKRDWDAYFSCFARLPKQKVNRAFPRGSGARFIVF